VCTHALFCPFLWFDPRRRLSLAPTRNALKPSRAEAVKAGPPSTAHRRLGLDGFEHDGMLGASG
jgi:hypothetical protein